MGGSGRHGRHRRRHDEYQLGEPGRGPCRLGDRRQASKISVTGPKATNDPGSSTAAAIATDERSNRLNTKAAGIIGLAVMCSRLLGLLREQIFAALFGGGM